MTVPTFELDPVTVALRSWLEVEVEAPVEDSIALPSPPSYYAVLFQLSSHRGPFTVLAALAQVDVVYQVTCVGEVPSQARTLADRVRKAIAGTDRMGAYVRPMDLGVTGLAVIRRDSNEDGALDVVSGIPQWAESYRLTLSPA